MKFWLDLVVLHPYQHYFSHITMMEGWNNWRALAVQWSTPGRFNPAITIQSLEPCRKITELFPSIHIRVVWLSGARKAHCIWMITFGPLFIRRRFGLGSLELQFFGVSLKLQKLRSKHFGRNSDLEICSEVQEDNICSRWKIIRIFNGCDVRIENSIMKTNCLASQGLPSDSKQLSRVTELSICTVQS